MEEDGKLVQVDPDDVGIGTVIVVKPGERIPLDGIVVEGESMVDTAALTGESVPRRAAEGDEIISGCVNGSGTLKVKVTKAFEDSTVSKILECKQQESKSGELYHQICKILHSGCYHWSSNSCNPATDYFGRRLG